MSAAAVAAAAAAAAANAIKASGAIVRVEPATFLRLVERTEEPLVVLATGGFLRTHYRYLMGYKGLIFFAQSDTPLTLPAAAEVIRARKISIPD